MTFNVIHLFMHAIYNNLLKSFDTVHDISAVNRDWILVSAMVGHFQHAFNAAKTPYMIISKCTSHPHNVQ